MPPKDALTRVPTQITCKFLDSTTAAVGRRRGRNYRPEPNSVNLFIKRLHTYHHRENRGGHRCVRGRIIGSEIALSTRCHIQPRNSCKLLKIKAILFFGPPENRPLDAARARCGHPARALSPVAAQPSGICASPPGSGTCPFRGRGRGRPPW